MKKEYQAPLAEIIRFQTEEVLANSIIDPSKKSEGETEVGKVPLF